MLVFHSSWFLVPDSLLMLERALLPYFIPEDLFLLQEDRKPLSTSAAAPETRGTAGTSATPSAPATTAPSSEAPSSSPTPPTPSPELIFGKNLKNMLVLVQDPAHRVMERADGLLLKDILKAVGYTFEDVAIVNIANCKQEQDWQTVNQLSYTHLFSFGVNHPKLPATTALEPYKLENSGDKKFLLTDSLAVLRAERGRKISLWNLLKQIFV